MFVARSFALALVTLCLALFVVTQTAQAAETPAHYIYRGSLTHFPDNTKPEGQEVKRFQVDCFVDENLQGEHEMNFLVSENGSGGWHWSQRFGALKFNISQRTSEGREWMVLNRLNESEYPVRFRSPWFEEVERLSDGATWEESPFTYKVKEQKDKSGELAWHIYMQHNLGRHQELLVQPGTGLIVEAKQTVFMGQGDRFQLGWKLEKQTEIGAEAWLATSETWSLLASLQSSLKVDLDEPIEGLGPEQLTSTIKGLPDLKSKAAGTPFESFVRKIGLQVELQQEREDSLASLAKKYVGNPVPKLALKTMKGVTVPEEDYAGKPIILHFWRYQDQSLKAPYGQTGYLDFLFSQREKDGVKVYGVAVDSRVGNPKAKRLALLQIRKTVRFMNLSYPVTVDDGTLLSKFGNIEKAGGRLPLWVVVAPDGKVSHYFAGLYEVKPNEGLHQLDKHLTKLLEAK